MRTLITAEQAGAARRRRRLGDLLPSWPIPLARVAVGAVALVAVGAIAGLAFQALRPPAVEAQLGDLARVAEEVAAPVPTSGGFVYSRSEGTALIQRVGPNQDLISFLHPQTRETWLAADLRLRVRTTIGAPTFFTSADARALAESPFAADFRAGRVSEQDFAPISHPETNVRVWSTDPVELLEQMEADLARSGSDRPFEAQLLRKSADLLRSTAAPPALRGAVLRLLGDVAGLDVETLGRDGVTVTEVRVEFTLNGARVRQSLTFDAATAHLVEERMVALEALPDGIPAGTEISIRYIDPPVLVDSIEPAGG